MKTRSTTARLDLDHPALGLGVMYAMATLALVSFLVGVPGLMHIAAIAGLPNWAQVGVPISIDGGLVVMALAATVQRQRRESAGLMWTGVIGFTLVSVLAQIAHVTAVHTAPTYMSYLMAIVLGSAPPVVTLLTTEAMIRLVIGAPVPKRKPVSARRDEVAQSVRPVLPSEASVEKADDAGPASPPELKVVRNKPRSTGDKTARDARIIELTEQGHSSREVARLLADEGIELSASTVTRVLKAA